jgi:hypothetical protein
MLQAYKTLSMMTVLAAVYWLLVSGGSALPVAQTGAMQSVCLVMIAMWLWTAGSDRDKRA